MIKNLPKLYRQDLWVNSIYDSVAEQFTAFKLLNKSNLDNVNFDTLDNRGCRIYEKDLQISPNGSIEIRRANIKAKWNANYKCSVPKLQEIADSYYNGLLEVSYNGDAVLVFTTLIGLNYFNYDFTEFEKIVDEIKPAHFDMIFKHNHNAWQDYFNPIVWRSALAYKWGNAKEQSKSWKSVQGSFSQIPWSYCATRTWGGHLTERIEYDGNENR